MDLSGYNGQQDADALVKAAILGSWMSLTEAQGAEYKNIAAIALAGQDAIARMNTGTVSNFAIIELGFKEKQLVTASFHVFKKDTFDPGRQEVE